jgi:hypothetical protein
MAVPLPVYFIYLKYAVNHVYLETCSSTLMNKDLPSSPNLSPISGRMGARISKSLSHVWERDLG